MNDNITEKVRLLNQLKDNDFNVPDFIYVSALDLENGNLQALESFLNRHTESYKVFVRSAHPKEEFFKSGTFDSIETYADLTGVKFAISRIISLAKSKHRLSILRQKKFNNAPEIDMNDMGAIVMPFVEGMSVMTKMLGKMWEYGYSRDRSHKVSSEPYITNTPHDRRLISISEEIQQFLGFQCEIEYIITGEGDIYIVQARDISHIEVLEQKEHDRAVKMNGLRRFRRRRNYRERPIYVMDIKALYTGIIDIFDDIINREEDSKFAIEELLEVIAQYEKEWEEFALKYERFAILGLSIEVPEDLYQVANQYIDDMPDLQKHLIKALHENQYRRDYFLAEADTIIAKEKIRINLGSHEAYGIDTVRTPLWSVFWSIERHDQVIGEFKRLGFKTGDSIVIDVGVDDIPTVYRH